MDRISRRKMMRSAGGAALASSLDTAAEAAPARSWPILEGPDTPKLALALGDGGGPLPADLRPAAQPVPNAPVGGGGRGGATMVDTSRRGWKYLRRSLRRQPGRVEVLRRTNESCNSGLVI